MAAEANMALASCYRLIRRVTGRHWSVLREAGTEEVTRWFVERTRRPEPFHVTETPPRPSAFLATEALRPPSVVPTLGGARRLPICGGPHGIAVRNPDLAYITRVRAAAVERLDVLTGRFHGEVHLGCTPSCVVFDAMGARAYVTVQYCDEVAVIDAHRHVQIQAFAVSGNPYPLALSPRGHTLFVTTNEDRLFGLNVQTGRILGSLPLPATSHHLLCHPAGGRVYIATRTAGSVLEVDTTRYEVIRTFALGGWPQGMALSPDATTLYVANERHGLDAVSLVSGRRVGTLALDGGPVALALSPDARMLYTGLVHGGKVAAIDARSLTLRSMIDTGGHPRQIAFDGARKIIVANEAGWVDIFPSDGPPVYLFDKPPIPSTIPSAASAS
jgi:DNA-binding beta-propeller fold protein YncE